MLSCGDDAEATETVRQLAANIGFEAVNFGPLAQARLIEPMALVWIRMAIPLKLGRDRAFAMVGKE